MPSTSYACLQLTPILYQYITISEPTVYRDSHFGDGDGPIVYSNLDCKGYEDSLSDCSKHKYGNFSCSRERVAGIKCQDGRYLLPITLLFRFFCTMCLYLCYIQAVQKVV